MKKWIIALGIGLLVVPAWGQMAGLPFAGGMEGLEGGKLRAGGGIVLGDDFNLYGVRGTFAVMPELAVFGDAGLLDPDMGDMGWALQGGGLFNLPLDLPVQLGVRGTLGLGGHDFTGGSMRIWTLNGGILASKTIQMVTPYAFGGLNIARATVDLDHGGDVSDTETDLALAVGASLALNEQISFYGELAHIDDLFIAGGARFTF